MDTERSKSFVVHSGIDVNFWELRLPGVDEVRPGRCPCCGAASRPPGQPVVLVGHGLRDRQVRGPPAPGQVPRTRTVRARRYRCRACASVITVVPRGIAVRKHYGAGAIGLALLLYGSGLAAGIVRHAIAGTGDGELRWRALVRWIGAVDAGSLFPRVRPAPPGWSRRQRAERAAATLRAVSPLGADEASQVFDGAARAA